ncbi:MAG: hypothetical protein WD154_07685 [Nitrosopumilaceae archaeon]
MPTVEDRLLNLEEKVSKIEKQLKNIVEEKPRNLTNLGMFEKKLSEKTDDINTKDLVLICLKLKQKQTKLQIENTVESWGRPARSWFKTNNFKVRLKTRDS